MVISTKQLSNAVLSTDGNQTRAAKKLGITKQAIQKRLRNNPQLKKAILNVREEALKRAGLSRSFVYRGIKQGCQANVIKTIDGLPIKTNIADHDTRHKFLKTALELHKDLDPDKEQSVQNIGAIIFQVLSNPHRQRIEVV